MRARVGGLVSLFVVMSCSSDPASGPAPWVPYDGGFGTCDGVEAPATHPTLEQTICKRTVPESVLPSIACTPDPIGPAYDGCSRANKACGPVTGCVLERDEPIDGTVTTVLAAPPPSFVPPPAPADKGTKPIPGMGVTMHGTTSGWFARGDGTPAQGSCGYPPIRNLMATAISHTQFGSSDDRARFDSAYWCGACAEVVGRSGRRIRVEIIDQCAGCEGDHLDIAAGADAPFSMMEDPTFGGTCPPNGEQPVDWKIVPCETCGGLVVHYVEGFNAGTPSLQLSNHRLPVVRFEIKHLGAWVEVRRESHNEYYPPRDGEDALPLEIRVTDIEGATITGSFPVFVPGKTYEATSNF